MKKIFFLLFISTNIFAEPCNVEIYSKIFKLENVQSLFSKDVIKSSNCSDEINNKISLTLSKKEGEVFASVLEKEIGNDHLHITPRKISLNSMPNVFREQLTTNSNLYFFDLKTIGSSKTLVLNEDESIKAYCESCNTYGEKNIKIEITNPIANTSKALWYTGKIFAKIKVIKAKNTLSFQQKNLSKDDFYTDETFTMLPDNILGSLENIQFYKPNKTILAGTIVTNMDIMPVNLVNYGVPVKASLKNQTINLTKIAMPTRSAQFGETVELKVGNNKSVSGKVIDFNQVVIEL